MPQALIDCSYLSYRLTPSVHYPTPIEEGLKVVRHVLEHYQAFGIDPNYVFLCGDSAGLLLFSNIDL